VKVSTGDFNQDVISYTDNSYLGKTDYPFVGSSMYPINPLTVTGAATGEFPLGVTLNQTAKNDENGEKLLYNGTKKEELQAVLPGQTVPILTKGIITVSSDAVEGGDGGLIASFKMGSGIKMGHTEAGKITGCHPTSAEVIGKVIATGSRETTQGGLTDQFGGNFAVIQLGL
jgi:hypothetical protein